MTICNWKTQCYNVVQSLLFNNRHRVIEYQVQDESGAWHNRADTPAPVRRLYETETTSPQRTCLQTLQFVHHVLIPPGGRHVAELHIHPDAEEIVVVTAGCGEALIGETSEAVQQGDVAYVPPGVEHLFKNTGQDFLGLLFINAPTGEGLRKFIAAQQGPQGAD